MDDCLSDLFEDQEFCNTNLAGAESPENLFDIFETLEDAFDLPSTPAEEAGISPKAYHMPPLPRQMSNLSSAKHEFKTDVEGSPAHKRLKSSSASSFEDGAPDGPPRASHIIVERNRRKQMNENLSILRSLMPSFYIKRADQASIIGGVVSFIKELQQVLRSLEEKKQRKVYSEVLSPRPVSSPRPSPLSPRPPSLSPRPPPLSPRISGLPISPRTPQPTSPYNPRVQQLQHSLPSPKSTFHEPHSFDNVKELAASSKSRVANVEVKFAGSNLQLKTTSPRIPGQALKIISTLEGLALEVLHVSISTVNDDTMLNSFTIKIGIECELSAEDLANEIQQTFC